MSKLISYFSILVYLQVVSLPIALSGGDKTMNKPVNVIQTVNRKLSTKGSEYFSYKDQIIAIEIASKKQLEQLLENDSLDKKIARKVRPAIAYLDNLTQNSLNALHKAQEQNNPGDKDKEQQFLEIYNKYQIIASDVDQLLINKPLVQSKPGSKANRPQTVESKLDSTNTSSSTSTISQIASHFLTLPETSNKSAQYTQDNITLGSLIYNPEQNKTGNLSKHNKKAKFTRSANSPLEPSLEQLGSNSVNPDTNYQDLVYYEKPGNDWMTTKGVLKMEKQQQQNRLKNNRYSKSSLFNYPELIKSGPDKDNLDINKAMNELKDKVVELTTQYNNKLQEKLIASSSIKQNKEQMQFYKQIATDKTIENNLYDTLDTQLNNLLQINGTACNIDQQQMAEIKNLLKKTASQTISYKYHSKAKGSIEITNDASKNYKEGDRRINAKNARLFELSNVALELGRRTDEIQKGMIRPKASEGYSHDFDNDFYSEDIEGEGFEENSRSDDRRSVTSGNTLSTDTRYNRQYGAPSQSKQSKEKDKKSSNEDRLNSSNAEIIDAFSYKNWKNQSENLVIIPSTPHVTASTARTNNPIIFREEIFYQFIENQITQIVEEYKKQDDANNSDYLANFDKTKTAIVNHKKQLDAHLLTHEEYTKVLKEEWIKLFTTIKDDTISSSLLSVLLESVSQEELGQEVGDHYVYGIKALFKNDSTSVLNNTSIDNQDLYMTASDSINTTKAIQYLKSNNTINNGNNIDLPSIAEDPKATLDDDNLNRSIERESSRIEKKFVSASEQPISQSQRKSNLLTENSYSESEYKNRSNVLDKVIKDDTEESFAQDQSDSSHLINDSTTLIHKSKSFSSRLKKNTSINTKQQNQVILTPNATAESSSTSNSAAVVSKTPIHLNPNQPPPIGGLLKEQQQPNATVQTIAAPPPPPLQTTQKAKGAVTKKAQVGNAPTHFLEELLQRVQRIDVESKGAVTKKAQVGNAPTHFLDELLQRVQRIDVESKVANESAREVESAEAPQNSLYDVSKAYTGIFNKKKKYILQYLALPAKQLETCDITNELEVVATEFKKNDLNKLLNKDEWIEKVKSQNSIALNASLQKIEKEMFYSYVKEKIKDLVLRKINISNYAEYYDENIGGDDYLRYTSEKQVYNLRKIRGVQSEIERYNAISIATTNELTNKLKPYKSCQELAEELNVLEILNIFKIDEALIEHIRERGELVKTFTKEMTVDERYDALLYMVQYAKLATDEGEMSQLSDASKVGNMSSEQFITQLENSSKRLAVQAKLLREEVNEFSGSARVIMTDRDKSLNEEEVLITKEELPSAIKSYEHSDISPIIPKLVKTPKTLEIDRLRHQLKEVRAVLNNKPEIQSSSNTGTESMNQSQKHFSNPILSNNNDRFNNAQKDQQNCSTTTDEFNQSLLIESLDLASPSKPTTTRKTRRQLFNTTVNDRQNLNESSNNNEKHRVILNNTALLQANINAVSTGELEIPEEDTKATTNTPSLIWTGNLKQIILDTDYLMTDETNSLNYTNSEQEIAKNLKQNTAAYITNQLSKQKAVRSKTNTLHQILDDKNNPILSQVELVREELYKEVKPTESDHVLKDQMRKEVVNLLYNQATTEQSSHSSNSCMELLELPNNKPKGSNSSVFASDLESKRQNIIYSGNTSTLIEALDLAIPNEKSLLSVIPPIDSELNTSLPLPSRMIAKSKSLKERLKNHSKKIHKVVKDSNNKTSSKLHILAPQNSQLANIGTIISTEENIKYADKLLITDLKSKHQENIDVSKMEVNVINSDNDIQELRIPLYHDIPSDKSSSIFTKSIPKQNNPRINVTATIITNQGNNPVSNPKIEGKLPKQMVTYQHLPKDPPILLSDSLPIANKQSYNNLLNTSLFQKDFSNNIARVSTNKSTVLKSPSNQGFNESEISNLIVTSDSPYYQKIAEIFNSIHNNNTLWIKTSAGDFAVELRNNVFYIAASNSMDLRKLLQTNSNKLVEVSGIKQIEYSKEIPQAFNATNEKLASSSQSSFPSTSLTTKNQDNVFTPHNVMVQNNNQRPQDQNLLAEDGFDKHFGAGLFDEVNNQQSNQGDNNNQRPQDQNLLAEDGFDEHFGAGLFDEVNNQQSNQGDNNNQQQVNQNVGEHDDQNQGQNLVQGNQQAVNNLLQQVFYNQLHDGKNQNLASKRIDSLEEVKHKTNEEIFATVQELYKTSYDKERLLAKTEEIVVEYMKESGCTLKDLEYVEMLFDTKSGSDASKLIADASNFPTLTQAVEAIKKNITVNTSVQETTAHSLNQVSNSLSNRIHITSTSTPHGVAAGDEDCHEPVKYGVWAMPLYNQAEQKAKGSYLGYKVKSGGGIVGVDTSLNNDLTTIGAAFSIINSNIKHKTGYEDKTKADSLIFSLYGKQNITEGLFIQGLACYSSTKVRRKEQRIFSFGNMIAKANYKSSSYGWEILLGYDAKLGKALVTPFAGISYIKFKDGAYRETGLPFANRTVAANKNDRTDAIVGARLSTSININNGMVIIPEVHGVLSRRIKGKSGKIVAKIDGMNEPFTEVPNTVKIIGNLGVSVTAKSGMLEYGAGYDLQLANKYIGHQGTLKIRVNF